MPLLYGSWAFDLFRLSIGSVARETESQSGHTYTCTSQAARKEGYFFIYYPAIILRPISGAVGMGRGWAALPFTRLDHKWDKFCLLLSPHFVKAWLVRSFIGQLLHRWVVFIIYGIGFVITFMRFSLLNWLFVPRDVLLLFSYI